MFTNLQRFETLVPSDPPETIADLDPRLRIYSDEQLEIWYSPMGESARKPAIWILGITPGWNQMRIAYEGAAEALRGGASAHTAAGCRKPKVAFAGSMRENLIAMLDSLDLPRLFELDTSRDLFGSRLLRTGSVLKYPVFKHRKNYAGSNPAPAKHPVLREMLDVLLAKDIRQSASSIIIPLGKAVESALEYSIGEGRLTPERVLWGFPHPSGANGHRVSQFKSNQRRLKRQLGEWFNHVA